MNAKTYFNNPIWDMEMALKDSFCLENPFVYILSDNIDPCDGLVHGIGVLPHCRLNDCVPRMTKKSKKKKNRTYSKVCSEVQIFILSQFACKNR